MQQTQELTQGEILRKYPRLTAHMVCESLGYFTPGAAANAILHHKRGEAFYCEWYTHMAGGFHRERVIEVGRQVIGRAFKGRHLHTGFMAHYPLARALVEEETVGRGPVFSSW